MFYWDLLGMHEDETSCHAILIQRTDLATNSIAIIIKQKIPGHDHHEKHENMTILLTLAEPSPRALPCK